MEIRGSETVLGSWGGNGRIRRIEEGIIDDSKFRSGIIFQKIVFVGVEFQEESTVMDGSGANPDRLKI